jgi:hypothetical protein
MIQNIKKIVFNKKKNNLIFLGLKGFFIKTILIKKTYVDLLIQELNIGSNLESFNVKIILKSLVFYIDIV